jgi:hypothetical protein
LGTVALIDVSLTTVNDASLPLKLTAVAPVKPLPVIVTVVPHGPIVGVKLLMLGAGAAVVTVKVPELVAVALPAVTVIAPVCAPVGTIATT